MSVTNGEQASATTFNGAFVSKLSNSTVISQLTLNRPSSGAQVPDVQQAINSQGSRISVNELAIGNLQVDLGIAQINILNLQTATPKVNFVATTNPTATDDSLSGYRVGSRWINTTNNSLWTMMVQTPGAAVWKRNDKERFAVSFFTTLNMAVNNLNDTGYVELVADTGADEIRKINAFYPAGSILIFAIGAALSEVDSFILQPGGGVEEVTIPPNSRVSLKLVSGQLPVDKGVLAVNFLTEV